MSATYFLNKMKADDIPPKLNEVVRLVARVERIPWPKGLGALGLNILLIWAQRVADVVAWLR